MINVIRCDEAEYLVWKWRPAGRDVNSTKRENAIRYGSSLRVKDGEMAVFVYRQNDGEMHDYIVGPYDGTIKTANFPVLSKIVGLAFGGESPFQAEIYFINLSGNIQIRFAVPYFDVFDPRFGDFSVPFAARGSLTFNVTDYKAFIKLHRLIHFDLEQFKNQVKDAVVKFTKSFIINTPEQCGIPVVQIERKIVDISDMIQTRLRAEFEQDFGVNLKRFDLSAIEADKESAGWQEVRRITAEQQSKTMEAQTNINIKNLADTQAINAGNVEETMRIQREESQRAQKLQTETNFMGAHSINLQADVLKAGAESLGQMSAMGDGGGINAAGMMTGMAMGASLGRQMSGMMNQMAGTANAQMQTPPPLPNVSFMIAINGQQSGPYNLQQLQMLVQQGQLTAQIYVWRQGMANWEFAGTVPELASLFAMPTPPPMPPIPNVP